MITMLRSIRSRSAQRPSCRTTPNVDLLDGRCLLDAAVPSFYLDDAAAYQQYVQSLNEQTIATSPTIVAGDPSLANDLGVNYGLYFDRLLGNRPTDPHYPSYDPSAQPPPNTAPLPVLDEGLAAIPYDPIAAL